MKPTKKSLTNSLQSKILLVAILLLPLFLPYVSSAPPKKSLSLDSGLVISYPQSGYIQANQNISVRFWVFNYSDGSLLTNTSVNCTFNLINPEGRNVFRYSTPASSGIRFGTLGANACQNCFNLEIDKSNFTTYGYYPYQIRCQGFGNTGGFLSDIYAVNNSGIELPEGIIIVMFSILIILSAMSICFFGLYSLGHLMKLDFDLIDLAVNLGIFFGIVMLYYLASYYLHNNDVNAWLVLMIQIGGVLFVLVPMIAFILSLMIGTLNKKQINAGQPPRKLYRL